jgi:nucleotide-binding universal stress UspA family protein
MTEPAAPSLPRCIACAVDVDGDADPAVAEHIVDVASTWALAAGATLSILHACPPPPPLPAVSHGSEAAAAALTEVLAARDQHVRTRLKRLAERAAARGVTTTTTIVTTPGRLPELLAAAAAEQGAGLLVLASRARKGLAQRLLGSVAERTAHLSPVPVLLLPPD